MKNFIPFLLFILLIGLRSYNASAQKTPIGIVDLFQHPGEPYGAHSGLKRGRKLLPILANTFRNSSGNVFVKSDSAIYSYSNGRGGENIFGELVIGNIYGCLYDALGFDEATSWVYTNNTYQPSHHIVKTWDAQNRVLSWSKQLWMNGSWVNSDRMLVNRPSGAIVVLTDKWNTTSQSYEPSYKDSSTYNLSGQVDFRHKFSWDKTNMKWKNFNRYFYQLNNRGSYTEYIIQNWLEGTQEWLNQNKYEYTYNDSNYMTNYILYSWDNVAKKWAHSFTLRYAYDANYHKRGITRLQGTSKSYLDSTEVQTLTAEGDPLTSVFYKMVGSGWKLDTRSTYTYLKPGLMSKYTEEKWTGTSWIDYQRAFLFYDAQDQLTNRYTEEWNNTAWVAAPNVINDRYYYEGNFSNLRNVIREKMQVNLFPVPTNNLLTIAIKWPSAQRFTATIYNAEGKLCGEWKDESNGFYSKDIAIANFESGIYYLCIKGEKDSWSSTFTVQH